MICIHPDNSIVHLINIGILAFACFICANSCRISDLILISHEFLPIQVHTFKIDAKVSNPSQTNFNHYALQ